MTRLVAVAGAAPGAGKSTLCAGLADWLSEHGLNVAHFREQDVLTHEAFAPLAREFTTSGAVCPTTLLETTEAYLTGLNARGIDVAVTDALVPFVPSLMGWGYSETAMASFLQELTARLAWAEPVVVYLDDDPSPALARAIEREGPAWQDWLLNKLGDYPVQPAICDLETAADYLRYERQVTLRLVTELPWQLVVVTQTDPPSATDVQRIARERLAYTFAHLDAEYSNSARRTAR